MYEILERSDLTPNIHLFKIQAPKVAARAQAGQFIILRQGETGERIPLTLADWDKNQGSVTVVFHGDRSHHRQIGSATGRG